MNIPEEAIDAVEIELEAHEHWYVHDYCECECGEQLTQLPEELGYLPFRKHRATAALEAALPHIRAQIAAAIQRRKRDLAEGYSDIALAMLEVGMEEAARIAEGTTK